MVEELIVRQIYSGDLSEILEIQEECGLSYWSEDGYLSTLQKPSSINLVALYKRQRIGFLVASLITSEEAELYNIGVRKDHRRKGTAKILLKEFTQLCNKNNIKKIFLEVRRLNKGAIALYKIFNFQIRGIRKRFYENPLDDALLMECSLEE